jgi:DNA-binding response OmpR family regulator
MEIDPYLVDQGGQRFPLSKGELSLGRSPESDVFIADRRVSRCHAKIYREEGCYVLRDLGSTNGTFLNGRHIHRPSPLHTGDAIVIGSAHFSFQDPEATLQEIRCPQFTMRADTHEIWVNHEPVSLSPKEQALFDLLHRHLNEVCSKQRIADAVWPEYEAEVADYQIQSLVKRLREKIEPDPRHPVLVVTVRGHGYKLVDAALANPPA